jgi:carboxylesterase type B
MQFLLSLALNLQEEMVVFLKQSCLVLNIWSPDNATDLPVYVFIHGGSFSSGCGAIYNGTYMVNASMNASIPIVFVSINYRIGLLGFVADQLLYDENSGDGGQATTGNYGLLDQIAAIKWVVQNIARFGGNPTNITVGGEGAGGISTTFLMISPLVTPTLFQKAIIQSGAVWFSSHSNSLAISINSTGSVLREKLSCNTTQCFRNATVSQLVSIGNSLRKNLFGAAVFPTIDGYVLTDTLDNILAKGLFLDVPLLIGSTTNETSEFTCPLFGGSANTTQVQDYLINLYGSSLADEVVNFYGTIPSSDSLSYLNTVFSDSLFHCTARRTAESLTSSGQHVYLYTFNLPLPLMPACYGVSQGSELTMLFPTFNGTNGRYNLMTSSEQLSENMVLYWANFITNGDPNFAGAPTVWKSYNITSDDDLVIDVAPFMRHSFYNATCSGLWDQIVYQSQQPPKQQSPDQQPELQSPGQQSPEPSPYQSPEPSPYQQSPQPKQILNVTFTSLAVTTSISYVVLALSVIFLRLQ